MAQKIETKQQLISGNKTGLGNAATPVRDFNALVGEFNAKNLSAFQTLTDQAVITWDYSLGYNAVVTLDGNRTLAEPTNTSDGDYGTLHIIQDDTAGSRTLALPANFYVVNTGAGAITLSTAVNSVDSISWVKRGDNFYVTFGADFTKA